MMRMEKILQFLQALIDRCREDEVGALGAQLSYYCILAFFPFLIFVVSVLGFTSLSSDEFMQELVLFLPADTGQTVSGILEEVTANRSGALLSIGMLTTIWAASGGMGALMKGLNKAYDQKESRPFWKVRGMALLSTIVVAACIPIIMTLLIFGNVIGDYAAMLLHNPVWFELAWSAVRYAVPVAGIGLVFWLLYWIVPNRKLRLREAAPGALFTTVGWLVTSIGFAFYVDHFGSYTKTYGSLGGVIVLLIWLYISAMIVMIGGEINAALAFDRPKQRSAATQGSSAKRRRETMEPS